MRLGPDRESSGRNLSCPDNPHVSDAQVLSVDWCKYNDCVIATGSVDRTIKVWDVRVPDREVTVLAGHAYAVRR
jgi:WD40 repeat protein